MRLADSYQACTLPNRRVRDRRWNLTADDTIHIHHELDNLVGRRSAIFFKLQPPG